MIPNPYSKVYLFKRNVTIFKLIVTCISHTFQLFDGNQIQFV